jgi:hypothetical protein
MKKTTQALTPRKPYKLDPSEGGRASAAARKLKRDAQARRVVQRYAEIADLRDVKYRPVLQSLARVSILAERSYEHLKDRKSLLTDEGELCPSIDVFRRLAATQLELLKAVGLLPTSVLPDHDANDIEAAYERIEKMKIVREEGNGKIGDT